MHEKPLPDDNEDGRTEARTNLFLAATMFAGGSSAAVKIRDLSPVGAQVESFDCPEVGSAISLERGRLSVHGRVSWSTKLRCGVRFATRISVRDWMANPVNFEQPRVAPAVASVNAGAVPLAARAERNPPADGLAEDLALVSSLLEMLGDRLASDPAIATAHAVALHDLDIARQTLIVLAAIETAGEPERSEGVRRLGNLRIRGAQALGAPPLDSL